MQINAYFSRIVRLLSDSSLRKDRRETIRLHRLPRYTPTTTNLYGRPVEIVDAFSFLGMRESIVNAEQYKFEPRSLHPLIIDAGANVGVSVLYFLQTYPTARVMAFEPDPTICGLLRRNCEHFGSRVQIHEKGIWIEDGQIAFDSEGSDSGKLGSGHLQVTTCRLRNILTEPVDLLKMDIEGAEGPVLADCAERLSLVQNIFVEFHSFIGKEQKLAEQFALLEEAGFRLHIHAPLTAPTPFIDMSVWREMDMQINVFGVKAS